jgi:hypothetical protein
MVFLRAAAQDFPVIFRLNNGRLLNAVPVYAGTESCRGMAAVQIGESLALEAGRALVPGLQGRTRPVWASRKAGRVRCNRSVRLALTQQTGQERK